MLTFPTPRRDTVHWESVTYDVSIGDTVLVAPVLNPRYSILRAKLLSTNGDSIPNPVMYVRLRIDGIVRDSMPVGGANATLRWIQAMSGGILHAAGDSGRILRSTNDGLLWTEQSFGTDRMVGGNFPTNDHGYVLSIMGRTYKTEDGGTS
jgi:hypothetical protein